MKVMDDVISYYCFNIHCKNSVFYLNTFKIIDLPLNPDSLINKHFCDCCKKELISLVDVELKKAFMDSNIAS